MNKIAQIFETLEYGPAPEGPQPALDWLAAHGNAFGHFIDGAWTKPGKTFASENPASGAVLAQVTDGTADDVNAAVKAARKAFPGWAALSGYQRGKYLYAIARARSRSMRALFAVLETIDNGKPIRESRDIDIPLVARHFYHHAGWAQHCSTSEFPGHVPYRRLRPDHPVEFPAADAGLEDRPGARRRQHGRAEARRVHAADRAAVRRDLRAGGLPKGVVNIVTGDGDTGAALVAHPGVDKIAFTGSTEVGKIIRARPPAPARSCRSSSAASRPIIVFEDADIDSAVEGLVDAIWFNQGQVCCAGSRLLVQESIEERFITKLKRACRRCASAIRSTSPSISGRWWRRCR
jgi:aldehyde dehydrogenase (NAD+)